MATSPSFLTVFPTHVGVFPLRQRPHGQDRRLPHARGGVSGKEYVPSTKNPSSPRTWGCFWTHKTPDRAGWVFPTHVGVFPSAPAPADLQRRLPHARGGVSYLLTGSFADIVSSPRTWGCFLLEGPGRHRPPVFPTHVGVFPAPQNAASTGGGLPHARGGVSVAPVSGTVAEGSSPRTWGCFLQGRGRRGRGLVFPTHVGVFPWLPTSVRFLLGLPHARGGVSDGKLGTASRVVSSPRTWGCFSRFDRFSGALRVFPTHVGVFPSAGSSPTMPVSVFPTHVGVFLTERYSTAYGWGLAHARGGVSVSHVGGPETAESSPRTWGCFSVQRGRRHVLQVFPTHVGVFL